MHCRPLKRFKKKTAAKRFAAGRRKRSRSSIRVMGKTGSWGVFSCGGKKKRRKKR